MTSIRTKLDDRLVGARLSWRTFFRRGRRNETSWRSYLSEEVQYWRSLFDRSFPNQNWVSAFHERLSTNTNFPHHLGQLVNHIDSDIIRVLDVGSGPISRLGTLSDNREIEITAIDPLAEHYGRLFDEFGIVPRLRTSNGCAERLSELFPKNYFDLIYCRNALDHSYDPLLGIFEMVRVCKIDSYCWLQHAINEGENQSYRGLHQWNFSPRGTDLIISGRPGTPETSLRKALAGVAVIEVTARKWCTVRIRKLGGLAVSRG